jgi:hypothetical protein
MSNNEIVQLFDDLYNRLKMQSGGAIRSRWFHTEEACPGCEKKLTNMKYEGKNAISLNTFIFREQGVLIGYLLCGKCAKQLFKKGEAPGKHLPLHDAIEKTLKSSYLKKSGH